MTRINLFRSTPSTLNFVSWGKKNFDTTSTLIFAALLIVCSVAVGCSSDKPKTVSTTNESPIAQPTSPIPTSSATMPVTPVQQATAKPVHRRIVHKAPPTSTYADKTSGVSFQYPRKYALKTGDAANELVSSGPVPMDFVQPGGVALAAVSLPDSTYPELGSGFGLFQCEREPGSHGRSVRRILRTAAKSRVPRRSHGSGYRAAGATADFEIDDRRHGTPVRGKQYQW